MLRADRESRSPCFVDRCQRHPEHLLYRAAAKDTASIALVIADGSMNPDATDIHIPPSKAPWARAAHVDASVSHTGAVNPWV